MQVHWAQLRAQLQLKKNIDIKKLYGGFYEVILAAPSYCGTLKPRYFTTYRQVYVLLHYNLKYNAIPICRLQKASER